MRAAESGLVLAFNFVNHALDRLVFKAPADLPRKVEVCASHTFFATHIRNLSQPRKDKRFRHFVSKVADLVEGVQQQVLGLAQITG